MIEEQHIRFPKMRLAEDGAFNIAYNTVINSYHQSDYAGYYYRIGRTGQLTERPDTKEQSYRNLMESFGLFEYAERLYARYPKEVREALAENEPLRFRMWTSVIHDVRVYILKKNYKRAKQILKSELGRVAVRAYIPETRNDKMLKFMCRYSFFMLKIATHVYYRRKDV